MLHYEINNKIFRFYLILAPLVFHSGGLEPACIEDDAGIQANNKLIS